VVAVSEEKPVRETRLVAPVAVGCLAASVVGALAGEPAAAGVAINEIHATGRDWVELFNASPQPADVSGWRLVECDPQGRPRLSSAARIPRGTILAPRGYLLVLAKQRGKDKKKKETEEASVCAPRGTVPCVRADWRVSQKRGEMVRLIGPEGSLVSEASYPAHAVPKGRSWARQPDGVGAFAVGDPTPGRPNTPPPEK
jgi:hypothetical protein